MKPVWPVLAGIALSVLLMACGPNVAVRDKTPKDDQMTDSKLPTCASLSECRKYEGDEVEVVGTYTTVDPYEGRGPKFEGKAVVVRINLPEEENDGPYLEPFWHENARRPDAEMNELDNKKVRVVGVFHSEAPPDPNAPPGAGVSFGGAVLHPVNRVEAVE